MSCVLWKKYVGFVLVTVILKSVVNILKENVTVWEMNFRAVLSNLSGSREARHWPLIPLHAFLNALLKDIAGSQANVLHYKGQKANPSEDIIKHAVQSTIQWSKWEMPPPHCSELGLRKNNICPHLNHFSMTRIRLIYLGWVLSQCLPTSWFCGCVAY